MRVGKFVSIALLGMAGVAGAQKKPVETVQMIMPVFHQLVSFSQPAAFELNPKPEQNANFFLREAVLRGETVEHWTQMITFNGFRGAVAKGLTAKAATDNLAEHFQKACPDTFAYKNIGGMKISDAPSYLVAISCGNVADEGGKPGAMHSETTLVIAMQGDQDVYTLQWAVRGPGSAKPLVLDDAEFQKKFSTMNPIRVCPLIGEKAPYPSCLAD